MIKFIIQRDQVGMLDQAVYADIEFWCQSREKIFARENDIEPFMNANLDFLKFALNKRDRIYYEKTSRLNN